MGALAGAESFIALEGDLSNWKLSAVAQIASVPRGALRRQTSDPLLDFAILPLQQESVSVIFRQIAQIGFNEAIVHIQIEMDGTLAFGACDNFHPECVFASEIVPAALLDTLVVEGLIDSYRRVP